MLTRALILVATLVVVASVACGDDEPEDISRYSVEDALAAIDAGRRDYRAERRAACLAGPGTPVAQIGWGRGRQTPTPGAPRISYAHCERIAAPPCQLETLFYRGGGVWVCGSWRFDERTGETFWSP